MYIDNNSQAMSRSAELHCSREQPIMHHLNSVGIEEHILMGAYLVDTYPFYYITGELNMPALS
jgi:hypothetical protein